MSLSDIYKVEVVIFSNQITLFQTKTLVLTVYQNIYIYKTKPKIR